MSELPELDRITDKVLAYRPAKQDRAKEGQMAEVRKMNFGGEERSVIELPFEIRREDWAEYAFADGGGVRVKVVVARVWQVVNDDGKPVYDEDGDRAIITEHRVDIVPTTT